MLQILLYMILQCCQKSQTILSAADTRIHKLCLVILFFMIVLQRALPIKIVGMLGFIIFTMTYSTEK